ncbi:MAG TPA: polyprenyl synthetase family protein [Acidimicrobiales bacterium]|jgi:geranylgeranyl diphosphate synthase type I|nr:polyprenyl synthetase family protein [Acidimicrobiales bacterium]
MTPPNGVSEVLARGRRAIDPALADSVERLSPELRLIARYHLGWCDPEGRPVSAPGGKGIRPTLAVLGAAAVGADPDVGILGGVAVELVHNYSLIIDDIIDGDTERHHRATVWSVFGVGQAIVAGDALQVLAHQVLLEAPAEVGAAASAALAAATATMIAGQSDDIAFESRPDVTLEQCTAMSSAKTGALLGCAASIGAILAAAPGDTVAALRDYGRHLGLAFQAVDDLLGIWGDPARTGKPKGSDLRQHKKSMPVVFALTTPGAEAEELRALIVGPDDAANLGTPLSAREVARATQLVEACGAKEWTTMSAKTHLDAALGALERVPLSAVPRRELADLAVFVVERES